MRKIKLFLAAIIVASLLSACTYVPPGNVGILVNLLGSGKGVDDTKELGVGRYWVGVNEELYIYPTFTQNHVWTKSSTEGSPDNEEIEFQTVEGMTVSADVGISYAVIPDKVPYIFQKYRKGLEEITHIYIRNMVRDAFVHVASTEPVENVYGAGKTKMLSAVEAYVREQTKNMFTIERIYLVGNLRLPELVTAALNGKIEATQRAQQIENEIRTAKAEAEKTIATSEGAAKAILIEAEGQASANKILAASITPELVQYRALDKWNGILPTTMIPGGSAPFINVK